MDQETRLYELFCNDVEDLGKSSADWWREELEIEASLVTTADDSTSNLITKKVDYGSPVFKTPCFSLKSRKCGKSCNEASGTSTGKKKRNRGNSPGGDDISELDCYSPFKSSKLSPITASESGSGAVPSSLEPLLQEGSDVSWNSAFATPLASNVTWSSLNSHEKKVLMPANSCKNSRVLFSPMKDLEFEDFCQSSDLNEGFSHDSLSNSTLIFDSTAVNTSIVDISDSQLSSKENIMSHSAPNLGNTSKKISETSLTKHSKNKALETVENSPPCGNVEKSLNGTAVVERTNETSNEDSQNKSKLVLKLSSLPSTNNKRCETRLFRKRSLVKTPDSGMNDYTGDSVQGDLYMKSPLTSNVNGSLTVSRKLFHTNKEVEMCSKNSNSVITSETQAVEVDQDSGAIGCNEITRERHLTSLEPRNSQSSPINTNETSRDTKDVSLSSIYTTQDFPHDISYSTLEEICQVTELLAGSVNSPVDCSLDMKRSNKNKKIPLNDQDIKSDNIHLSRTSTPITHKERNSKLKVGARRKKIKFVHGQELGSSHSFGMKHCEKSTNNEPDMQEEHQQEYITEWPHGGDSIMEKAAAEFKSPDSSIPEFASRVHAIRLAADKNKFVYSLANRELKKEILQNEDIVLMEDVVKSAEVLEKAIGMESKNKKINLDMVNMSNEKQGFVPFCNLQELSDTLTNINNDDIQKESSERYVRSDHIGHLLPGNKSKNIMNAIGEDTEPNNLIKGNVECIDVSGLCGHEVCDMEEQSKVLDMLTTKKDFITKSEESLGMTTKQSFSNTYEPEEHNITHFDYDNNLTLTNENVKVNTFNDECLTDQDLLLLRSKTAIGNSKNVSTKAQQQATTSEEKLLAEEKVHICKRPDACNKHSSCDMSINNGIFSENIVLGNIRREKVTNPHNAFSDSHDDIYLNASRNTISTNNLNIINHKNELSRKTEECLKEGHNKAVSIRDPFTFLENKSEKENMSDSQIVHAAEHAELMDQLAEVGSAFSQWSCERNDQEALSTSNFSAEANKTSTFCCIGNISVNNIQSKENNEEVKISECVSVKSHEKQGKENIHAGEFVKKLISLPNENSGEIITNTLLKSSITNVDLYNNSDNSQTESQIQIIINKPHINTGILDLEHNLSSVSSNNMQIKNSELSGFFTANGKRISISEILLQKVRTLYLNCDTSEAFIAGLSNSEQEKSDTLNESDMTRIKKSDFINSHCEAKQTMYIMEKNLSVSSKLEDTIKCLSEPKNMMHARSEIFDGTKSDKNNIKNTDEIKSTLQQCEFMKDNEKYVNIQSYTKYLFTDDVIPCSENNLFSNTKALNVAHNCGRDIVGLVNKVCLLKINNKMSLKQLNNDIFIPNVIKSEHETIYNAMSSDKNMWQHETSSCNINSSRKENFNWKEKNLSAETYKNSEQDYNNDTNVSTTVHVFPSTANFSLLNNTLDSFGSKSQLFEEEIADHKSEMLPKTSHSEVSQESADANENRPLPFVHSESNTEMIGNKIELLESERSYQIKPSSQPFSAANEEDIFFIDSVSTRAGPLFSEEESSTKQNDKQLCPTELNKAENLNSPTSVAFFEAASRKDFVLPKVLSKSKPSALMKTEEGNKEVDIKLMPYELTSEKQDFTVFEPEFSTTSRKNLSELVNAQNTETIFFSEELSAQQIENDSWAVELNESEDKYSRTSEKYSPGNIIGKPASAEKLGKTKLLLPVENSSIKVMDQTDLRISEQKEPEHLSGFQGFSTASGKKISVSAQALSRAKNLLSKEEFLPDVIEDDIKPPEFKKSENQPFPVYQGFSTASGKKVGVSSKALKRAKLLFSEEEMYTKPKQDEIRSVEFSEPENNGSPIFKRFSTGNSKEVCASAMTLSRANPMLLEDETYEQPNQNKMWSVDFKKLENEHSPIFKGFSTASGKKISVSAKALSRAKILFSEEEPHTGIKPADTEMMSIEFNKVENPSSPDFQNLSIGSEKEVYASSAALSCRQPDQDEVKSIEFKKTENQHSPIFQGFSTASGKNVPVSAKALHIAKRLFSEEESSSDIKLTDAEIKPIKFNEVENSSPVFQRFSAGSTKEVNASALALNETKSVFSEEESYTQPNEDEVRAIEVKNPENQNFPIFQGFSTASGKKVPLSAKALNRAKLLFSEEESSIDIKLTDAEMKCMEFNEVGDHNLPVFQEFSTESGKEVLVSSTALSRVKPSFSEEKTCIQLDEDEVKSVEFKKSKNQHSPIFQGFSTASGKNVPVSAKALSRAKHLFSEEEFSTNIKLTDAEIKPTEFNEVENGSPVLQRFSTSSGKKVSLSTRALNRAKSLFSEGKSCTKPNHGEIRTEKPENLHSLMCQGFSTASGKKMSISAKALSKAKQLFLEEEHCMKLNDYEKNQVECKFSTADGKIITVAPETLSKAELLFSDENCCIKETANDGRSIEFVELEKQQHPILPKFSADGKEICVSTDALNRGKSFLEEESCVKHNENESVECQEKENQYSPAFKGFSTANGKNVCVSAEALRRARVLFSQEEFCSKSNEKKLTPSHLEKTEKQDLAALDTFMAMNERAVPTSSKSLKRDKPLVEVADKTSVNSEIGIAKLEIKEKYSPILQKSTVREEVSLSSEACNKSNILLTKDQNVTVTSSGSKSQLKKMSTVAPPYENKIFVSEDKQNKTKLSLSRRQIRFEKTKLCGQQPCEVDAPRHAILKRTQRVTPKSRTSQTDKSNHNSDELLHIHRELYNVTGQIFSYNPGAITEKKKTKKVPPLQEGESNHVLPSLTQEVRESAAALLADEATSDSPSWVVNYVSCPDMVYDRVSAPSPIVVSSESLGPAVSSVDPGSPVFGRYDRCRKKQRNSMSQSTDLDNSTPVTSTFKVPYKSTNTSSAHNSSTPTQSGKRTARHLVFSTPFVKRLKTSESEKEIEGFHHTCCTDECIINGKETCLEVVRGRKVAAEEQERLITSKIKSGHNRMQPCNGSYYLQKQEQHFQMKWRDAVKDMLPGQYTRNKLLKLGVKASITDISSDNAVNFRFSACDYYSQSFCQKNVLGLPVGDGALLVLDAHGTAGIEEVTRAFLSSPSIEPSLIPTGWVHNHYRWLVWKLAAIERSFPEQFASRCLTPNILLLQLKYRYDREVDHCERSAIRKILERDDSAAKRLVLCVARIIKLDGPERESKYELELTDGWYSLTASMDQELCTHIHRGTIAVGTKLICHGAELLNCEQGCSPLEVGRDVRLKLCSNSTRRVRWDTKLGFYKNPGPLKISLTSILPSGGMVSSVPVLVVRVYPLLYIEKHEGGKSVIRSIRAEERAAAQWERTHQACVEQVYSQVKRELHKMDSEQGLSKSWQTTVPYDLSHIFSGEKLCRILESSSDPASVEVLLSDEQKTAVAAYRNEKQEKLHRELEDRVREKLKESPAASRNVVSLFKVRCVDPGQPLSNRSAILSVWRPPEDVTQLLKEGATVTLFNVTAAGIRSGDLQLSTGRQTVYQPSSHNNQAFFERRVVNLNEVTNSDFHPPFGELDVVGMVAYIGSAPQGNSGFQTVYLADAAISILGLTFWGGVKNFGWEEILKPRTLVAASNLQWRQGAAVRWVPCAYVSELSTFSENPRQSHLQQALASLRQNIGNQDLGGFSSACENKVSMLLRGSSSPSCSVSGRNPGDSSHIVNNQGNYRPAFRGEINSPQAVSIRATAPVLSADELANSSKKSVERRLHKLKLYGEPPALSPVVMPIKPALRKPFHVPVRRVNCPPTNPQQTVPCKEFSVPVESDNYISNRDSPLLKNDPG